MCLSASENIRTLGTRLLRLAGLNIFIGLVIASVSVWSGGRGGAHALPAEFADSLTHSMIYGLLFGLAMPYLAERLSALRAPLNWAAVVASLALLSLSGSLLVQSCLLASGLEGVGNFWTMVGYKTAGVFVISLVIGLCVHTYETVRGRIRATNLQLRTQELEKERALKLATEARLASLESRLHPHFLFNTLNSISALIVEDPALAEQTVQRLAALLRTSLDACERERVTLGEEIKLVTDYLEIERARFRERLSYSTHVEAGLEALPIPPLTLQPLVENSVKYAVSPRPAGGTIRISARPAAEGLTLEVWDDGPGFSEASVARGHGLDNLRARLHALLGEGAGLSVDSGGAGTTVTIHIPAAGPRAAPSVERHGYELTSVRG
jgi:two-component system, LytTR family, sensor histidine kinase AlgZ